MYSAPPPLPPIDPSELRPRRRAYVVAAGIAVVLSLLGVGGFVWGLFSAFGHIRITNEFQPNNSVVIQMNVAHALYVGSLDSSWSNAQCEVNGTSGESVPVDESSSGDLTIRRGGYTWDLIGTVDVPEPGDYVVVCRSEDPVRFGAGPAPSEAGFTHRVVLAVLSLTVLPFTGIATGGVITIVTGVKRSRMRRRLLAERFGGPRPPFAPAPYGQPPYQAPYQPSYQPPYQPPYQNPPPYRPPEPPPSTPDEPGHAEP